MNRGKIYDNLLLVMNFSSIQNFSSSLSFSLVDFYGTSTLVGLQRILFDDLQLFIVQK